MPMTTVLLFREGTDSPALRYLDGMSGRAKARSLVLLELLAQFGHQLRRPHADLLEDGIYELRADEGNVHHRFLYFFHGQNVVILTHGLRKERIVPPQDIVRAKAMRERYIADPTAQTQEFDL